MKATEFLLEYYNPEEDRMNQSRPKDTRRPRLTLKHLHELRKIKELKNIEAEERSKLVKSMYKTPSPDGI